VKLEAIRRTGAALVTCGDYDEAERLAKAHAATRDALFISPYAHPDVIAGAGTIGLEILEDRPQVDTLIVPVGGGGLIAGIAAAAGSLGAPRVVGVEAAASSPFTHSLAAGRIVRIDVASTVADGLAGNLDVETPTFAIVRDLVHTIAVMSEEHIEQAIKEVFREERLVIEGAGAVGVAAVLAGTVDLRGRQAAIVLSGGNIDPAKIRPLI
jgi:threonine dehydratase